MTVKLAHLALYMDEYSGYAPKLDLREIHFPNLQSLEFGNYVFSHDGSLTGLFIILRLYKIFPSMAVQFYSRLYAIIP